MRLKGAQILINCLAEQGVDCIFGYPGASVLALYDCLPSSPIRHILAAHEQGACFAAEGYARAGGRPGVVLATSGPGATNLVTGIADAYMDSVPLIAITGNVPLDKLGHDSFQEVDVFDMTMPITKYNMIVKRADEIAPAVRKAFHIATSGRKGPVLIDVPSDVFEQLCEYEPCAPVKPAAPPRPDEFDLEQAAEMINAAKRPVIYAGGGVKAGAACAELAELALALCAPVTVSYMGIGCFDSRDPSYLGVLSDSNNRAAAAVRECDLFITLGARFNSRYNAFGVLKKKKIPLLQFDVDRAEVDKNVLAAHAVVGDLRASLAALLPKLSPDVGEDWTFREFPEFRLNHRGADVIRALCDRLGDVTITTDVGLHQEWAAHSCSVSRPERFLTSGGLGSMGFGVGAAIGAHFATGGKCLTITGDGSFNMNCNELTTAVRNHVPLVVAVLNNNSLGMVRKLQIERGTQRHSHYNALYLGVDYAALARSMGARGVTVGEEAELGPAIDEALKGTLPLVIDFRLPINTGIQEK